MSKTNNLTVCIQAGGESRRMGRSKATVPFLGEPLLKRVVARLLPVADEFLITTNEPENLSFLEPLISDGTIRLVTDMHERRGALRGIHTAFEAATKDFVALVACDMIFPSAALIEAELDALVNGDADVAIPHTKYGYEPFHGVYRRATCLKAVADALEDDEERAAAVFERVKIYDFTSAMVREVVPEGNCFINTNTPEQLAAAEAKVLEIEGAPHAD